MDSLFDEVAARLQQLEDVRGQFTIRAEQLAADLALVGLHNELRDATYSAAELCRLRAQSARSRWRAQHSKPPSR